MITIVTCLEMALQFALSFIILRLYGINYVAILSLSQRFTAFISFPYAGTLHQYLIRNMAGKTTNDTLLICRYLLIISIFIVNTGCLVAVLGALIFPDSSVMIVYLIMITVSFLGCSLHDESFGLIKYLRIRSQIKHIWSYSIIFPRCFLLICLLILSKMPTEGAASIIVIILYTTLINLYGSAIWKIALGESFMNIQGLFKVFQSFSVTNSLYSYKERLISFMPFSVQSGVMVLYPLLEDLIIFSRSGTAAVGLLRLLTDAAGPSLVGLKLAFSSYGPRLAHQVIHGKTLKAMYTLISFFTLICSLFYSFMLIVFFNKFTNQDWGGYFVPLSLVAIACLPNIINSASGPSGIIFNALRLDNVYSQMLTVSAVFAIGLLAFFSMDSISVEDVFYSRIAFQLLMLMLVLSYFMYARWRVNRSSPY